MFEMVVIFGEIVNLKIESDFCSYDSVRQCVRYGSVRYGTSTSTVPYGTVWYICCYFFDILEGAPD